MKFKVFGVAVLTVILSLVAFVTVADAQTFRADQSSTIASSETVDGSAFITGSAVDIAGKVNGDLYCIGQNVTISGTVEGDVLCAAQTITFTGSASGNIRLAGQTVSVSGNVTKSASLAGQTVTIDGQAQIGQDATMLGQSVTVNGKVSRDIVIASSAATVNGAVGRNVTANVETLNLANNATVGGALNYTSPQKITMDKNAVVTGKVTYTKTEVNPAKETAANAYNPVGSIVWSLMLLASAVVFALLFPSLLHRVTGSSALSVPQSLLAVLVGFVAGIVMPIAIVLLMITVLGIPFALVVLLTWILILSLSGVFAAYYVGRIVWRTQTNAVLIMLVGALIIIVLLLIPIVNVLVWLLAAWYGSGVILLRLKELYVTPKYDIATYKTSRAKA